MPRKDDTREVDQIARKFGIKGFDRFDFGDFLRNANNMVIEVRRMIEAISHDPSWNGKLVNFFDFRTKPDFIAKETRSTSSRPF